MMTKILKKGQFEQQLPCTLTKVERLAFADKLGEVASSLKETNSKKKALAAQIKSVQAEHGRLSDMVSSGIEYREVVVEELLDFEKEVYSQVRTDTGEVIYERALTDAERQTSLMDGDLA
jgi:hypothetical protein